MALGRKLKHIYTYILYNKGCVKQSSYTYIFFKQSKHNGDALAEKLYLLYDVSGYDSDICCNLWVV
jgi:hypothetical protein